MKICLKFKALVVTIQMLHLYHLQKMVLYNLANSNSRTFPVFSALGKKDEKFSEKIPRLFDIILLIWSIRLFHISYNNYDQRRI